MRGSHRAGPGHLPTSPRGNGRAGHQPGLGAPRPHGRDEAPAVAGRAAERVQRVRAAFVTGFLRQIRAMLDRVGARQNRRIPTCYLVPVGNSPPSLPDEARDSSLAECLFNALDVATWIEEGLVDYLVVHLHVFDGDLVDGLLHEGLAPLANQNDKPHDRVAVRVG